MAMHLDDPGDQVWFIPTLIASEQSAQIFQILLFYFSQRGLVIIVHSAYEEACGEDTRWATAAMRRALGMPWGKPWGGHEGYE